MALSEFRIWHSNFTDRETHHIGGNSEWGAWLRTKDCGRIMNFWHEYTQPFISIVGQQFDVALMRVNRELNALNISQLQPQVKLGHIDGGVRHLNLSQSAEDLIRKDTVCRTLYAFHATAEQYAASQRLMLGKDGASVEFMTITRNHQDIYSQTSAAQSRVENAESVAFAGASSDMVCNYCSKSGHHKRTCQSWQQKLLQLQKEKQKVTQERGEATTFTSVSLSVAAPPAASETHGPADPNLCDACGKPGHSEASCHAYDSVLDPSMHCAHCQSANHSWGIHCPLYGNNRK